jgi:hypothetical protein
MSDRAAVIPRRVRRAPPVSTPPCSVKTIVTGASPGYEGWSNNSVATIRSAPRPRDR